MDWPDVLREIGLGDGIIQAAIGLALIRGILLFWVTYCCLLSSYSYIAMAFGYGWSAVNTVYRVLFIGVGPVNLAQI